MRTDSTRRRNLSGSTERTAVASSFPSPVAKTPAASSEEMTASSNAPSGSRTRHSYPAEPSVPSRLASSRMTGTSKCPGRETRRPMCAEIRSSIFPSGPTVVGPSADSSTMPSAFTVLASLVITRWAVPVSVDVEIGQTRGTPTARSREDGRREWFRVRPSRRRYGVSGKGSPSPTGTRRGRRSGRTSAGARTPPPRSGAGARSAPG